MSSPTSNEIISTVAIVLYRDDEVIYSSHYRVEAATGAKVTPEKIAEAFVQDMNLIYSSNQRAEAKLPEEFTSFDIWIGKERHTFYVALVPFRRVFLLD